MHLGSIVSVEFFDTSLIMYNCINANLAKGMAKRPSEGHPGWHLSGEGGIIQRR